MKYPTLDALISLLKKFESSAISYQLNRYLDDSISILIVVPGERWEVDINQFGEVQIEIFKSNGEIYNVEMLDSLFQKFSD